MISNPTFYVHPPSSAQPINRGSNAIVSTSWYAFFENVSHKIASLGSALGALGGYASISAGPLTNSLSGDVLLNNVANYFDGPTVAQGTAGTWFASGTVTMIDTSGAAIFDVKLWDGTTVIASTQNEGDSNAYYAVALSGIITSPTGNIRISVKDLTSVNGGIIADITGNGNKDSTITAFRIA